jgi:hypothetical protein
MPIPPSPSTFSSFIVFYQRARRFGELFEQAGSLVLSIGVQRPGEQLVYLLRVGTKYR